LSISTLTFVQNATNRRLALVQRWDDLSTLTKTRLKVVLLLVVVFAAYHYSLTSLLQTVGFDTPLAYIGLVPVLALGLAWIRRRPRASEPAIHDRQLDYIIGVPLVGGAMAIAYVLPGHLGDIYWVNRVDLLSLPIFVAGVVTLLFGTRVLWRQRAAVLYLFLAWPWPYTTILLGTLGGFTDFTVSGLKQVLNIIPVAHTLPGAANQGIFVVSHHGQTFPVSVVTACSGVDGMVGFLLVGAGFATLVTGPFIRKVLWLASGLALLWATNILRLVLIFWVGQKFGEQFAVGILHPVAGLVIFCFGVLLMLAILKPFGLRLADFGSEPTKVPEPPAPAPGVPPKRQTGVSQAVPRVFLAGALVAIAGLLLSINNSALRSFDPVASAAGLPKLTSFIADPGSPAGWAATYVTQFDANKPFFGTSSVWDRYAYSMNLHHVPTDLTASLPVTADVINAGGLSGFEEYGVTACYSFHGYELRDVAKVSLGQGIKGQALSYASANGFEDWTIVYWIWPVKMASGTRYERIILYLQNTADATVIAPSGVSGITGISNALKAKDPADRRLITNRAFLVAFARQLIVAQTHQSDAGATVDSVAQAHQIAPEASLTPASAKLNAKARARAAAYRAGLFRLEQEGKLPNGSGGVYATRTH
jgi:exosortase